MSEVGDHRMQASQQVHHEMKWYLLPRAVFISHCIHDDRHAGPVSSPVKVS